MNEPEDVPLYPGISLPKIEPVQHQPAAAAAAAAAAATAPITTQLKLAVGPNSSSVTCTQCGAYVRTCIKHTVTSRTHILAMLCQCMCCCCLPYCMDSARNTDHYCPNCKAFLGTYEK